MVVFAVKSTLMCNVVGRANRASSMDAFEATLVIRSSIHSNLFDKENAVSLDALSPGNVR